MVLDEFAELGRVLNGVEDGLNPNAREVLQAPLDGLLSSALELNLVYTPGNVGSCTAASTLANHPSIKAPVTVGHHISKKSLLWLQRQGEECARWPDSVGSWRESVFWSWLLRVRVMLSRALCLKGGAPGKPFRKPFVVTGVREPIAGDLSGCFYSWWEHADTPAHLTLRVVQEALKSRPWHLRCNDWFDDELKQMFGIDVFARAFPMERGWEIYENDVARVLLIRQENLGRLSQALGALYKLDPSEFVTVTANAAESKDYAPYYRAVKDTLRYSKLELDRIYSLPYVAHFYTPTEIATFRQRWQA